ncbi:hypothetical protein GCM10009655_11400 [Rhodoglobus aureus]|uniref:Uncharacterized protein n=1 Tax=Rhodoglobus aureus TaxID=191497 RepID=A0ABP4G5J0_9MICO
MEFLGSHCTTVLCVVDPFDLRRKILMNGSVMEDTMAEFASDLI